MNVASPEPETAAKPQPISQRMLSGRRDYRSVMLLGVTRNTNNYGVRVLLSTAVAQLAAAYPDATIEVLDYGHSPESWTEATAQGEKRIQLVDLRFSWRLYLPNNILRLLALALVSRLLPGRVRDAFLRRNPWLKRIAAADAHFSLAGGDSFSDIYRLERFFYVVFPQLLVLWLRRPLVLLPQTYGPFKGRIAQGVAGYIFRRATQIFSRDRAGVATVQDVGGAALPVTVLPDLGFAMEPQPMSPELARTLESWRAGRPVVGINVSKLLYMGGYTKDNMFGLKEDYPRMTREIIAFAVQELGAFVLLVPHVFGGSESQESELTLCRSLVAELRAQHGEAVGFLDAHFSHREIKDVIGRCDVFTGARMHACIAAVSQCVPTVAQAYSDKFEGVMAVSGCAVPVVDLRRAGAREVGQALREALDNRAARRGQLRERMPVVKRVIEEAFA